MSEKKDIACEHSNIEAKDTGEGIYIYELNDKMDLILCPQCNLNLAGAIAKQQAVEVFAKSVSS